MTRITALLNRQPDGRDLGKVVLVTALGIALAAWVVLVVAATLHYPGQPILFLLFVISYSGMACLALPSPRLYVYTFLAVFLFLGFSAKAVAFLSLGVALVEPTGTFSGTGPAWDAALRPAIVGCLGVVTLRLGHLVAFRRSQPTSPLPQSIPSWYVKTRLPVLVASVALILALNLVNLFTAFYQIGVSPRIILPAHLNALIAWLLVTGLALWAATLFGWEAQLSRRGIGSFMLVPFAEAMAATSTLGRAAYLFQALPYLLVATDFRAFFRTNLVRPWRATALLLLPAGFVVSIVAVSLLRIVIYPLASQAAPGETPAVVPAGPPAIAALPLRSAFDAKLKFVGREVSLLIVGRWIGLEGTMSVSSSPLLSFDLLGRGLGESPTAGEAAIYQRMSGSTYQTSNRFVFLTTPGAIGVLDYSGSLPVVFVGMFLLTALLIVFELLASRLVGSAFIVSIVAITLANAVAQMDFPYLFFVLVAEQAVALTALSIVMRVVGHGDARRQAERA